MARSHALRALLLAVAVLALTAAPAAAAPKVRSLDAIVFTNDGRHSGYVVFNFRTRGATQMRVSWRRHGGARQRVRRGRVGIGFAHRGMRFRISARACKRGRCGPVKRYSGRFRRVNRTTDPPGGNPPGDGPDDNDGGSAGPEAPTLPQQPPIGGGPPVSAPGSGGGP